MFGHSDWILQWTWIQIVHLLQQWVSQTQTSVPKCCVLSPNHKQSLAPLFNSSPCFTLYTRVQIHSTKWCKFKVQKLWRDVNVMLHSLSQNASLKRCCDFLCWRRLTCFFSVWRAGVLLIDVENSSVNSLKQYLLIDTTFTPSPPPPTFLFISQYL